MASPERLESFFARNRTSGGPARHPGHAGNLGEPRPQPQQAPAPASQMSSDAKARFLRKMEIVKRARFNAAKRLEGKHDAGQLALAIAGVYGFLIPLFTLQFKGAIVPSTLAVIDFVAVVAGALSFAVGFLYQERNYKQRAGRMHACALEINQLRHELFTTHIAYDYELQGFVTRYGDVLARHANHDEIDYKIAIAEQSGRGWEDSDRKAGSQTKLRSLKLERFLLTHGLNVAIWCLPPLVGIVLWFVLPVAV